MECRVCQSNIDSFMSFGLMPISNRFLKPEQFEDEYFFELKPAFCETCGTFQLVEQPAADEMFHDQYSFFSRTSRKMVQHFHEYSQWVLERYLTDKDPFIVEIGSNDGILLENFDRAGVRYVGIEPSNNVAEDARSRGINTISGFFDFKLAERIVEEYGKAQAVIAANVMCHIPDLHAVANSLDKLLAENGIFIFEDPYLGDMIEKTSYDQIYDEHVYIFSVRSVKYFFGLYGFELIESLPQKTHGGSMRYVFSRTGSYPVSDSVPGSIFLEDKIGLGKIKTFEKFRDNCLKSRDRLLKVLHARKKSGQRVVGYGATSKSTTVLNYCGISPDLIEFISDTTPIKQGKFSPGVHIPIRPYEDFKKKYPENALLFAWNHKSEIMDKEADFMKTGGEWIVYVPEVAII